MSENANNAAPKKQIKIKLPEKTSMNLYIKEKTSSRLSLVIPVAIILAIFIALFTKFAVIDRLNRLNKLQQDVNALQSQLDALNAEYADVNQVREDYRRYSGKYLKKDNSIELRSRTEILDMVNTQIRDLGVLRTISIVDNYVSISVDCADINDVEAIRASISLVDYTKDVNLSSIVKNNNRSIAAISFSVIAEEGQK